MPQFTETSHQKVLPTCLTEDDKCGEVSKKETKVKCFSVTKALEREMFSGVFTFDNLNRHFLSCRQTSYATFTLYNVVNVFLVSHIRSTPPDLLRKKCSENMQQTYRRTPMSKGDFDKVTKKLY